MIVVIKNFFRNEASNLTIRSVRHFMPEADVYVQSLFKHSQDEYAAQPELDVASEKRIYAPTKYHGLGPSVGNLANNLFFSEAYNLIAQKFAGCDDKVLMLAEDHFFTTGATLRELKEKEFDVAFAAWHGKAKSGQNVNLGANGSILCVRPARCPFPIPEVKEPVEHVLYKWVMESKVKIHELSTRDAIDYKGDGFYTNDAKDIREALSKLGIV